MRAILILFATLVLAPFSPGQAGPDIADPDLQWAFSALSRSTLESGGGWQDYDRLLHPDYSRWAMGQVYEGREKFVRSLEAWWNYGMRVKDREIQLVGVDEMDDIAIIRFSIVEKITGPDGPVDPFIGYVSNTWVREDGRWLLLSAEISATDRDE